MATGLLLSAILSIFICLNYCQEFDYPANMPNPSLAQISFYQIFVSYVEHYESPIQVRILAGIDSGLWNCRAVYESKPLDILTKKEPRVRADNYTITNYGTANSKSLCAFYSHLILIPKLTPDALPEIAALYDTFGLNSSLTSVDSSISDCDATDSDCLESAAFAASYSPKIMGSIVAHQVLDYLANDGWNADGTINRNGDGRCTSNCRPYSDTTGYEPVYDALDKWQPLEWSDEKGFFYRYNHVVPHIGFTAVTKFTSRETLRARSSPNPNYDYDEETQLVVERLKDLATNDTKKMLVELFDDKIAVSFAVYLALDQLLGWSYEEGVRYLAGFTAAEYEAVIHAWREKRIWDMVRPTTLIKNGVAGDTITTYGGPYQGVKTIDAADFEAFQRVMPHSEYPSGSGCICLAISQFVTALLEEEYNITDPLAIPVPAPGAPFVAGSSKNEPGTVPANNLFITLESMDELNEICGESRLWGGMHFTASIEGAWDLCDGVGEEAYDFIANIEAGNVDAFGDEEEIPDFEEEYELELERRGINKSKGLYISYNKFILVLLSILVLLCH